MAAPQTTSPPRRRVDPLAHVSDEIGFRAKNGSDDPPLNIFVTYFMDNYLGQRAVCGRLRCG
jgi:hypothetical protein